MCSSRGCLRGEIKLQFGLGNGNTGFGLVGYDRFDAIPVLDLSAFEPPDEHRPAVDPKREREVQGAARGSAHPREAFEVIDEGIDGRLLLRGELLTPPRTPAPQAVAFRPVETFVSQQSEVDEVG